MTTAHADPPSAARERLDPTTGTGYEPPASPDEDGALPLGIKMALGMTVAYVIALRIGFEDPTWSVLTAAFLATNPPIDSARAAGRKVLAMVVGIAIGVAGAYAAKMMSSVPVLHIAAVGMVAGALGSRSPDYLFAAVVGTVVAFVGSGGGDPTYEVATRTICMILIGCVTGPLAVFAVEKLRAMRHERGA